LLRLELDHPGGGDLMGDRKPDRERPGPPDAGRETTAPAPPDRPARQPDLDEKTDWEGEAHGDD
jgi:hypothetical protein